MNYFAPIVMFTYDRPNHTMLVINSLLKNKMAKYSKLIIYSDGPKTNIASKNVDLLRRQLDRISGFKEIEIIKSSTNKGLADSIISGVSHQVDKHGSVIVLEDDTVVSPDFLEYMNFSLEYYKNEDRIWHIAGWNYPISRFSSDGAFLWRMMECWGWATWQNRWCHFEKNSQKILNDFTQELIHRFNLDGTVPYFDQIKQNVNQEINTWAVFWYATIFLHDGLCLAPEKSLVKNIGFDGSGTNGGYLYIPKFKFSGPVLTYPTQIKENSIIVEKIKKYHLKQNTFKYKLLNFLKKNICKIINI